MRVAGSGVERPAAGPILLYWGLPARRRARGSGESRGTERDRRPFSGSGKAGRKSAPAKLLEKRLQGGRFVRGGGVFALSRRDLDGGRTILHLEQVADINRHADSSHPRWDWAMSNGMNELLVHLAGSQQTPGELEPGIGSPPIRWCLHPDERASEEASLDAVDELADPRTRQA